MSDRESPYPIYFYGFYNKQIKLNERRHFNMPTNPYAVSNEFNLTQILAKFDTNYIYDVLEDKLETLDYVSSLEEPNMIASFEENFKLMKENFPGDSENINLVRQKAYLDIIEILCKRFNLEFNSDDESIDLYTAAFYLYDFLVCNRNNIMVNFFTAFIVNNKESLYSTLDIESYKKNKSSSIVYGKHVYADQKYVLISSNIEKVISYIGNMDITLLNIFQSTYINQEVVIFLDNAFLDRGNFFKDFYCSVLNCPITKSSWYNC